MIPYLWRTSRAGQLWLGSQQPGDQMCVWKHSEHFSPTPTPPHHPAYPHTLTNHKSQSMQRIQPCIEKYIGMYISTSTSLAKIYGKMELWHKMLIMISSPDEIWKTFAIRLSPGSIADYLWYRTYRTKCIVIGVFIQFGLSCSSRVSKYPEVNPFSFPFLVKES